MPRLLPLPLAAAHTRDVEAFPSYLCRLAMAHGLTPGQLIKHAARGDAREATFLAALRGPWLATLVRPNETTAAVVELIARSGSESIFVLQRSNFGLLHPAVARTPRGFSAGFRWCPACLREQLLDWGHSYLKLSWFVEQVRACHEHHLALRSACPHCGHVPKFPRGWAMFEICEFCDGRLDKVLSSDVLMSDPDDTAPDLIALVDEIATASDPFPAGAANNCVAEMLDRAWRSEREGDLWNKLPRDECLRYACDDEPISLAVVRRLAYRLEMPIAELLRGGANARLSFNFAASCPLPKSMCSAHRAGLINSAALIRQLRVYLEDDGTPPSLREIARRIGVSVGALRHHAPAIVKRLADSRRSHLQTTRRAKKQAAQIAVRNGVRHWSKLHPNPIARKSLLKSLMKETGLPKELLRKTIRQELKDQVA